MNDPIAVAATLAFFVAALAYVRALDRLIERARERRREGGRS